MRHRIPPAHEAALLLSTQRRRACVPHAAQQVRFACGGCGPGADTGGAQGQMRRGSPSSAFAPQCSDAGAQAVCPCRCRLCGRAKTGDAAQRAFAP